MDSFLSMFPRTFLNISIDMVGDFNILAFNVLISSFVNVAKFVFMSYKEVTHICIVKIIVKEELGSWLQIAILLLILT